MNTYVSNLRVFGYVALRMFQKSSERNWLKSLIKLFSLGTQKGRKDTNSKTQQPESSTDLFIDAHVEIPHNQIEEDENDNEGAGVEPDQEKRNRSATG